ncbi:hypothetical protein OROMI_013588 [Orobanche minor]
MEETSEKNKMTTIVGREPFFLQINNPCKYFQEFIRTVFKCLGFASTPDISSSKGKDNSKFTVKEVSSSSAADLPPSTADPPPADDPSALAMLTLGRTPPTPPIGGGRGAQNN